MSQGSPLIGKVDRGSVRCVARIGIAAVLFVFLPSLISAADGTGFSANAVNSALNSTVFIEVERTYYSERFTTTGTGFFITEDGHILTNSHVVSDWIDVYVRDTWVSVEVNVLTIKVIVRPRTPHEKVLLAKVVATDRKRDLALIKASQPSQDFLELKPDTTVGLLEEVFVLGFPFGEMLVLDERGGVSRKGGFPEVSINAGRVASLRRDDSGEVVALQTDAEINPGNSGGPMINVDGELVGVVYAKIGTSQIGFAISPQRVWGFLQGQKINALFSPTYVTSDLRPVLLKVAAGALLESASGGRVIVGGPGMRDREFDLVEDKDGWKAALEFPPKGDGGPADHYSVHVFLEDENGRNVADNRYRIQRAGLQNASRSADRPRKEIFENELTLSDHARKLAAEKAVDDGVALNSRRVDDGVSSETEPTLPPVDLENLKMRARTYYRGGNYKAAAEMLAQIVAADPDDEVSRDYLELARERLRIGGGTTPRTGTFEATDIEVKTEALNPTAKITTYFPALPGNGTLNFWLDGEPLQPFSFSSRTAKAVEHSFDVAAGEHTLDVELIYGKKSHGRISFEKRFAVNSRWTLRLNLTSKKENATAYLVKRRD